MDASGIGLGSDSRLRRMRRRLGLPMPWIENLLDLCSSPTLAGDPYWMFIY